MKACIQAFQTHCQYVPIKHIFATSVGPWLKYGVIGWHLYCQRFWSKRWSPTGVGSCVICATHGKPHCASECATSGRRFWRNGSWWLCCFFLGILKAMKGKVLPECEGRRLLQFGWGLPVYLVYLFTSVHGWEGASCIWLQHVLASSNRPLCFLSLEADTQHVVHKLMAGRFGHSLLLGNIPAIYNFIRLANSCLMSKDPAARHFHVFSTFLDPEQCRAGCGLQGPYKKQVHWKRRSFDMWHEWLITGPVAVHFVVVSAHLMFSCTWA